MDTNSGQSRGSFTATVTSDKGTNLQWFSEGCLIISDVKKKMFLLFGLKYRLRISHYNMNPGFGHITDTVLGEKVRLHVHCLYLILCPDSLGHWVTTKSSSLCLTDVIQSVFSPAGHVLWHFNSIDIWVVGIKLLQWSLKTKRLELKNHVLCL